MSTAADACAIEIGGLRKRYGRTEAVRGIDLSVGRGEVFALLGPNGAGKTTTVEILEGYRQRDAGDVSVLGFDPADGRRELKSKAGIVLQSTGVDPYLTVAETVALLGASYPNPLGVEEVLGLVGLGEQRDRRVGKLSGGQRRRLDLAAALSGDPELLFLDEPTTGFDPSARREAWAVIKGLATAGKTVFLTTHYMEEAQYLADRVAILADGQIVALGAPSSLGDRNLGRKAVVSFVLASGSPSLPHELAEHAHVREGTVELSTDRLVATLHTLTAWALERGVELEGLVIARPSLEDVYLQLTSQAQAPAKEGPADG